MSTIIPLGFIGVIVAFLISVLGAFPTPGVSGSSLPGGETVISEEYSEEAVDEAANLFLGAYVSTIDDIISFQQDPNFQRAESRRQEMVDFATSHLPIFQNLEERLQGDLDELTDQVE